MWNMIYTYILLNDNKKLPSDKIILDQPVFLRNELNTSNEIGI